MMINPRRGIDLPHNVVRYDIGHLPYSVAMKKSI